MMANQDQITLSPVNRELFLIAWRVLTQFHAGEKPAAEDMRLLKLAALSREKRLRLDELACKVMQRELTLETV